MAEINVDKKLDCSGMLCPMPVVKTKKALKDMEIGHVLEMISTDAGAMPDMYAWAKQTGHELLDAKEDEGKIFTFLVKKTH
ncbi:MAG: sulfurtransferase TusA family protein [Saprospiraceae bacterium]